MPTYCRPLTTNEQADNGGYNHIAVVTADALTQTTANTAQTITLCGIKIGDIIGKVLWRAKTYFKDASDAAFNTTTMSVGDDASVTTYKAAIELNVNGTEVSEGFTNTAVGPYTVASNLTVTFNAMVAKSLSNIDTGEVVILFQLQRIATLEQSTGSMPITTK